MRKKKSFASPWIGEIITEGPCKGYRACEAWPADLEVHDTRASGSRRSERLLDHTGWYTDHFQDGMQYAAAVKVRVPRSRARQEKMDHPDRHCNYRYAEASHTRVRWVEAIAHTDWDCISIDRCTLHDTLSDAIRAADCVAERVAEGEREADAKDQAEQQIQGKREEIEEARATLKRVLGARKRLAMAVPEACEDLASYVSDQLQEIRKARKRIALLEREPWEAVAF